MKFVTFSCVLSSMIQLSVADIPENRGYLCIDTVLEPWDLEIPGNSYWKGILPINPPITTPRDFQFIGLDIVQKPSGWKYDWVEFERGILENSSITIHYEVQYREANWFGPLYWAHLYNGSELLCETQRLDWTGVDSSVGALVRKLLGIPGGCPVLVGAKYTSGIKFPLRPYHLYMNRKVRGHQIRILTNVHVTNSIHSQKLFTGNFYVTGAILGGEVHED